jgi:adenosine deaminase
VTLSIADLVDLPKAELHVHLELSIDPLIAGELATRAGASAPSPGRWPDQASFVRECEQVRDLIRDRDDLVRISEELVRAADLQGIWWTEVTCAPANYGGRLGTEDQVLEAVLDGLSRGCAATGRAAGVVLAHNRAHDAATGRMLLDLCERYAADAARQVGVVALGLVGAELDHPPSRWAALFAEAHERGVRRVPHAGEGDGPPAIADAWRLLRADRIAHGVRSLESAELVAELADAGICLDVCPTSNVLLGAAPSLAEHQISGLLAAGVTLSLGSDCTYLMGVNLVDEYRSIIEQAGVGIVEIAGIARNSFAASFAPPALRIEGVAAVARWLDEH